MHSALLGFVVERPDARAEVEQAAITWRALARDAFLDGYDEVASVQGPASARSEKNRLLELFMLEKAVYELRYEIENRPDWVRIPVTGLLDVLER